MPEVLTKHPDVVKKVLESAGAQCGKGLPQKILTACPPDAFCALPGGETCVYGVAQVGQMTQIQRTDLARHVCTQTTSAGCGTSPNTSDTLTPLVMLSALLIGFALGRRSRRPLPTRP